MARAWAVILFVTLTAFAFGERVLAETPAAEEIMRRSHLAFYYAGEEMKARITMRLISKDGAERVREMTMLRKDIQEGGAQRYFIYFHRPPDVRDLTFMVWTHPDKD